MRYSAKAVLPVEDDNRAAGLLRANLRLQIRRHETADWETFQVIGPIERADLRGRSRFEYQASVRARRRPALS